MKLSVKVLGLVRCETQPEAVCEGQGAYARCARDLAEVFRAAKWGEDEREHMVVFLIDAKHRIKGAHVVSVGTLTTSLVHPREVFRLAIMEGAAAIAMAHNHPSGDPEPSAEDVEITRRIAAVGKTVGIVLLDHVVVGPDSHVSIRERISW